MIPNDLQKQLEDYIRKEREEEERKNRADDAKTKWMTDKAKYTTLDDAGKKGYGDLAKAGMNLADRFAGLGGRNISWSGDLAYGGNKPLKSYYDPVTGKLILSADIGGGDALNAIAARDLADRLNASGKYGEFQDYALKSMTPEELAAARAKYRTLYHGETFGKNLDDLVNREAALGWAQDNLFNGGGAAQRLAYQDPELFAALKDANGATAQKLDGADGLKAVQGQFGEVNRIYDAAARAAAKSRAAREGRNPGNYPMADPGARESGGDSVPHSKYYTDKRKAIMGDAGLSGEEKAKKLRDLEIMDGAYQTNLDPTGEYENKLKQKTDNFRLLNGLQTKLDDETAQYAKKYLDENKQGFGASVPGANGDFSDPEKLVDVKINNKDIGNARNSGGNVTGNLDDIVTGFGGKVVWDKTGTQATVYGADGKAKSTITKYGDKAIEYDEDGNKINTYKTIDGKVQADFAGYADRMGVPYSYYHDRNGVLHTYVQTDMKDAPIKVVRKENDIYVDANLYFNIVDSEKIKEKLAKLLNKDVRKISEQEVRDYYTKQITDTCNLILSSWDYDGINMYNNNPANTPKADEFTVDPLTGKKLKIHTKLNTGDSLQLKPYNIPKGKNYVTINMYENSLLNGRLTSHVLTEDPKDLLSRPFISDIASGGDPLRGWKFAINELKNIPEAIETGQLEKALYNWDIKKPGQMWLYKPEDAAHEFGHLLGLGDAYGAFYRQNKDAPPTTQLKNVYGEDQTYNVPLADDLMRGYTTLSDVDLAMLLDAWRTGEAQYFDK